MVWNAEPSPRRRRRRNSDSPISRRALLGGGAVALAAGASASALVLWRQSDNGGPEDGAQDAFTPQAIVPPPATTSIAATPRPTAAAPSATPSAALASISDASVVQLRRALDRGELSVGELVQTCIDRIDELDGGEYGLGAIIEVNPEVMEIARTRERELRRGESRGPLHGIPVVVKDLLATADSMATTAGSIALLNNPAVRDAFLIAKLREAGAILLGKTNMTEWSNFKGTVQTSGWSPRGGQTRNPYRLDSSPWGSSSGSAVAVAAGLAPLAIGVETDGSITCPASATATVGLKPTVGLTSRAGVIPISYTQDSPGPMARSVADVAALLTAIAGYDPEDPGSGDLGWTAPAAAYSSSPIGPVGSIDYTGFLDPDGLRGARIGVARDLIYDPSAIALMDEILPELEAAGARVIDPVYIASVDSLASGVDEYQVLVTEFRYGLEAYFANYTPGGAIMSVADLVAFNEANAEEELIYHDQAVFHSALNTGSVWDDWYRNLVVSNLTRARDEGIDATIAENRLDALIAPSAGPPTLISLGGDDFRGSSSQLSAMSGYPIISVPLGYVDGLPVGLSFMGPAFSEGPLIALASGFEAIHPVREAPGYGLGTLD
jgi:amidase